MSFIHSVSVSYQIRAPSTSTRPPPVERAAPAASTAEEHNDDPEQPALVRFARLKQREQEQQQQQQSQQSRVVGTRVISTPPNPNNWSLKDTSVNIASAFHRAAGNAITVPAYDSSASSSSAPNSFNTSASTMNPNDSWAAGAQQRLAVPRSTSVEYEKETQSLLSRRLNPETRNHFPQRRPLARTNSTLMPDAEPAAADVSEPREAARSRTFGEQVADMGRRLAPATFFMRRQSEEPEPRQNANQNGAQDKSSSYDYSAEEREFQENRSDDARRTGTHRRIASDNKAYKPTMSDLDESESDYSSDDGGRSKRRKARKGANGGGPLRTLPVAGYDKRRKRRVDGAEVEEEEDEQFEGKSTEQVRYDPVVFALSAHTRLQLAPPPRLPQIIVPPSPRKGNTRGSGSPSARRGDARPNATMDMESGLQSIREEEEALELDDSIIEQVSSGTFSVGAILGRGVHFIFVIFRFIISTIWHIMTYVPWRIGRTIAQICEFIVRPIEAILQLDPAPLKQLGKYMTIALSVYAAWFVLNSGVLSHISFRPSLPAYEAPTAQPPDFAALSARVIKLEGYLEKLSRDTHSYIDNDQRAAYDLASRVGIAESRIQQESERNGAQARSTSDMEHELKAVRHELKQVSAELTAQQESQKHRAPQATTDKVAQSKLRDIEARLGSVEGGVKNALETSEKALKAGGALGSVAAWWNKIASGETAGVTIKSTDGHDVSSLVSQLVDKAVLKASKDTLARPDFAMYSGGASVIPSLTSETYEIRPDGWASQILGMVTGNGYVIGRPPVTALHHDVYRGFCWPFQGSRGQLGITLSAPVYIDSITIDHVPSEVATDLRSAPRQMELWGLVEGADNRAKVAEYRARPDYDDSDVEYTPSLNRQHFMQLAKFNYNIYAPQYVQTFSIPEEIQELGVDFGVVVLAIRSNWGREDFTCLYRVRVHGQPLASEPAPLPEEVLS